MINYTMMKFSNCKKQVWGSIRCRGGKSAKCTTKVIQGKPKYFYGYKYNYHQYSFPTGFRLIDEDKRVYNFGNTHRGAINQGRNRINGSIVGFSVKTGGNLDYWGLALEKKIVKKVATTVVKNN